MEEERKLSFSAAGVFPAKILIHKELMEKIRVDKKIPPIHLQINPTNKCNFNCPFCSCANRNKAVEMPYDDLIEMMDKAAEYGCRAVTITGDVN